MRPSLSLMSGPLDPLAPPPQTLADSGRSGELWRRPAHLRLLLDELCLFLRIDLFSSAPCGRPLQLCLARVSVLVVLLQLAGGSACAAKLPPPPCSRSCAMLNCDSVGIRYGKFCSMGWSGCKGRTPTTTSMHAAASTTVASKKKRQVGS
ncbi:uncharacterized protein [Triticum aestivum]|uniref:uncharacterized protein isoform X1 n=1 Tax=Triticum aestivum TaxID=4565 RepID=UPI001D01278C|nr:uncharacterized protein LOC123169143 isoform X1 [Triticum aestivum]